MSDSHDRIVSDIEKVENRVLDIQDKLSAVELRVALLDNRIKSLETRSERADKFTGWLIKIPLGALIGAFVTWVISGGLSQ